MVTALWIGFWAVLAVLLWREYTRPVKSVTVSQIPISQPNTIARLLGFKPEPVAPRDYPTETIPRTRGSWRKHRAELERAHNTKQQHMDKLTEVANGKAR